eukprot:9251271-Heterocapsa_arctica.AAC.1
MASCVVLSYSRVLPAETSGHCDHSVIATAAVPGSGCRVRSAMAARLVNDMVPPLAGAPFAGTCCPVLWRF